MYNYYLIITPPPFNNCCGSINYVDNIIKAATYGYAKLTNTSIIIKSNQNLKYWFDFLENSSMNNGNGYFIYEIDITKPYNGRSNKETWNWLTTNKEEILSQQCTAYKLIGCEEI